MKKTGDALKNFPTVKLLSWVDGTNTINPENSYRLIQTAEFEAIQGNIDQALAVISLAQKSLRTTDGARLKLTLDYTNVTELSIDALQTIIENAKNSLVSDTWLGFYALENEK